MGVGDCQVGMGIEFPGLGDNARRARGVSLRGHDPSGDFSRWHQVRRQLVGFERQLPGIVYVPVFCFHRLRGQQHGAAARGHRLINLFLPLRHIERPQRASPVTGLAL